MKILGISEGSHDAAMAVVENGEILAAHHAERYTRKKNEKWLLPHFLPLAKNHGKKTIVDKVDVIVGHENKERVNERRKKAGQKLLTENIPVDYYYNHYETHAWAGWATAPFDDCASVISTML